MLEITVCLLLITAPMQGAAALPADHPLRSAPTLAASPSGIMTDATLLATPAMRALLGYTRRPIHLDEGYTMGLFSYSNTSAANWLFLIDGRDLSVTRHANPNNDVMSHAAALGADGDIYIMPYALVRAYQFDVETRQFSEFTSPLPKDEYTWEALGGSNGRIYFGTYPNACFGEYDPDAQSWNIHTQVVPNTKYVTNFREDAEGRIHFRAWGPDEVWLAYDPRDGSFSPSAFDPGPPAATPSVIPPVPDGDESWQDSITIDQRWFALSYPSGRLWEWPVNGEALLLGDTKTPAQPKWWLKAVPHAFIGVAYYGAMFRYDLTDGALRLGQLDNLAPGANAIMFLETITPRHVVGANYSQQNLFTVDPTTGETTIADTVVARVSGEPMCAVGLDGMGYIGIYVSSIISVYDPLTPFAYGTNPRELIQLGDRYKQTRPRAAVTDGRLALITSDSEYNFLGGAMVVIEPATEKIDVYHHLVKDQNLPTLAYDPLTELAWGGTDRWGQMRSHPPTQESALVYAFDPNSRELAAQIVPWPGADVVSVHGVSKNGVLLASSGGQIALIHTPTREILYKGESPIGAIGSVELALQGHLRLGADGLSYCLSQGKLYRWDFETNVIVPIAEKEGWRCLTEPSPGLWLLADAQSIYRIHISQSSQTIPSAEIAPIASHPSGTVGTWRPSPGIPARNARYGGN